MICAFLSSSNEATFVTRKVLVMFLSSKSNMLIVNHLTLSLYKYYPYQFMIVFKVIVMLGYSGLWESFLQGGIGVPCPPFHALVAPPFDFVFYRLPVLASAVCDWVVEGLGWCERGVGGVMGFGLTQACLPEYV